MMLRTGQNHLLPPDILRFLGLDSYYSRFVEGFSSVAASLTNLTKNKAKFYWMKTCEKSFHELKERLTSAPGLTLPKFGENYTVFCNASRFVLVVFLCRVVR